ncbi:MAG: endonuclease/exonuclease/phosphatase family protein [bacterium]
MKAESLMLPANRNVIFNLHNSKSLFLILLFYFGYATQLKIVSYNLLNFPNTAGYQRIKYFRQIMDYLKPDILVVQEMQSEAGMVLFRDSVLNYIGTNFSFAPFNDGPDTDNGLFYCRAKVEFIDAIYIPTAVRDIARYRIRIKDSNREFFLFSVHLKSEQDCVLIRLQQATILRNHLDSLSANEEYVVVGDFNFYYNEPGYCKLVDSTETSARGLRDPLNIAAIWHENQNFAYVHTQSTRNESLNDLGATGGLDDRFDFVFCSPNLLDTVGLFLPVESYNVFGNDGKHFNKSINSGINYAVPDEIATALYFASDHLPVSVIIMDGYSRPIDFKEVVIFPNPMKRQAQIRLPHFDDFEKAIITVTNIMGQRFFEIESLNPAGTTISADKFNTGVYFVNIQIYTKYRQFNFRKKLAVIR